MKHISFSTKAGTLAKLNGLISSAQVPPSVFFTAKTWKRYPTEYLKRIYSTLGDGPFVVRSSNKSEDTYEYSQAGKFLSVLDVMVDDLAHNIELVFKSVFIAK